MSAGFAARPPLADVRVLDLSRLLPGGFCTAMLADLGAEVVKIEQPGIGDYMRWGEPKVGSESAASWVIDRGKRSVAVNLKDERGVKALLALARHADVIVESFRPGVVDRLGVGYEQVSEVNPAIVYCSISGYGQDGPLRHSPGHDLNYTGRAGLLSITGPADGRPAIPGVQIADLGAGGLMSAVGILAALHLARRTGEGDHIDISMTDGALAWLSVHLGDYLATGEPPGRERMLLNGHFPCYNVYECADGGYITVGAIEEQFWEALCEGTGHSDLIATRDDPDAVDRWRSIFRERTRDEWVEALSGTACVGPVNDFSEAVSDPQIVHRGMITSQLHPEAGELPQVDTPVRLKNHPGGVGAPAPALGADTRELLAEAGYAPEQIEELIAFGAVAE